MKTIIFPLPSNMSFLESPFNYPALPLFCTMAFLPAVLNLIFPGVTATNPVAAWGPVAAGFWIAITARPIRLNVFLLGPALSALLWSVNWFIMAGKCCSTMD